MIVAKACNLEKTDTINSRSHFEYYIGEKDEEQRKHGQGVNHWSGAKSLESYDGHLNCDTMHGEGDYYWRFLGYTGQFLTYEGNFFNNQLHGYGCVSYGDGRVFKGILHNNMRWGPGIESHAYVREDVGLWDGRKLVRLCWRPDGPSIAPDLMSSTMGQKVVQPHRNILRRSVKIIGKVNNALELLKRNGANPLTAVEKFYKLYPKHCTDLSSALCNSEMFESEYYMGNILTLEENTKTLDNSETNTLEDTQESNSYYVWNNNKIIKHMMKHSYKHENQRKRSGLDIATILSGPRNHFKPAGQHEIDSRTLLMASYLGHTSDVAQLINGSKIHPDVADLQGNTALMYATCGEQVEIIHFLVDAGANVNSFNDSCCTPLGIALIKLVCCQREIPANNVLQALLPTPAHTIAPTSEEEYILEWVIKRETEAPNTVTKSPSKINKNLSSKKIKSLLSLKDQSGKKKTELIPLTGPEKSLDELFSDENRLYYNISHEYSSKVTSLYHAFSSNPLQYIFDVNDMNKEIDANEEDHKKLPEKNPKKIGSRILKESTKPSKEGIWQSDNDENKSVDSLENQKRKMNTRIITVISQLLCDGANPELVKCPQSALFTAIVSGSSKVVRQLIFHGANVNEIHFEVLSYTPVDIAISRPFTYENLEIIKTLLEYGADVQHRLMYDVKDGISTETLGPTLFHAVLARTIESEIEEEIRNEMLELLLDYNCNPTDQFKGRSAIDISMTKSMNVFEIFIRHPKINLNAIINEVNQTVLVKMFYLPFFKSFPATDRLPKITDLLLFGASPLIKCQNGEEEYENIFVFAKRTLHDIEGNQMNVATPATGAAGKQEKNKKVDKAKKDDKISTKSTGKISDDLSEYKQALELVTECARLLHVRWVQGKLVKEVIEIINKFKHRHWNMILKEIQNKKKIGLWLTSQRCLEIWHILSRSKKKVCGDRQILKHLLNIVQLCSNRINNGTSMRKPLTAVEKDAVEKDVKCTLLDDKTFDPLDSEMWRRCYVNPELNSNNSKIFNVCFECALPLREDKMLCISCKMISFCTTECIKANIERISCHPCSNILKEKYFANNSYSI